MNARSHSNTDQSPQGEVGATILAPAGSDRTCILVVGMHRSGTSATAGVLAALGASTGGQLVPANRWNERGHFELQCAVEINERCLSALGIAWNSVQPLPRGWQESRAARDAIDAVESLFCEQFRNDPLCMIKDPRMSRLLPLWLRGMERQGVSARVLITLRDPSEVAASLDVRDSTDAGSASALWLLHLLDAEAASRSEVRTVVAYDRLLHDWRTEIARMATNLGLALRAPTDDATDRIDRFLSQSLRHHDEDAHSAAADRRFPLVRRAMEAFRAAANDEHVDSAVFDALRREVDEGILLWQRHVPSLPSEVHQRPAGRQLLELLELPLHTQRQDVLAIYWREAGEDYAQTRSVSCEYVATGGEIANVTVSLPCPQRPRFLRIDPAMASGLFCIVRLTVAGTHVNELPVCRVSGIALANHSDELLRLYAEHDDPWFEIDLDVIDAPRPASDELLIELTFQRVGIAESIERRLLAIEEAIKGIADAKA